MDYNSSISFLYSLQKHGIKLGLSNISKMLEVTGNPHRCFKSIHVAGTNGKGSTCAMIASILQSHGFKTALFTSPHMVRFTERIQINFKEIDTDDVVRLTSYINGCIQEHIGQGFTPTYFEFVTAIAFLYFKENAVDFAVVETGMGGRFDSTNVLIPKVSVITPISEDHKDFLGDTIEKIAFEKAGIVKQFVPVVSGLQKENALYVLEKKALEMGTEVSLFNRDFKVDFVKDGKFKYTGQTTIDNIVVKLHGNHQVENAACAIRAVEYALRNINGEKAAISLLNLKWPGRCELVYRDKKTYLLDGAHNTEALLALSKIVKNLPYKKIILVYGAMADKDNSNMLEAILHVCDKVVFCASSYGRAEKPEVLAKMSYLENKEFHISGTVAQAINVVDDIYEENSLVVVTGSFYIVGEVKEAFGENSLLRSLSESK